VNILIPQFKDVVDIILIAFLIYQALLMVRRSGGYQVLLGLVFIFVLYFLALVLELKMVSGILNAFRSLWLLALIILFQPEIRSLLAKFNVTQEITTAFKRRERSSFSGALIDAISAMSFRKIGALIVIETRRKLNDLIHGGETIDAAITLSLILTIFNPLSILHDGAIVIRNGRIVAAKVLLPLSKNPDYVKKFGTRHLAGVGITENSDAIAIIVSEQTGQISVAQGGIIQQDVAFEELMQIITDATK